MIIYLKKKKRLISGAFLALAAIASIGIFAIGHWSAASQVSYDVAMVQVPWQKVPSLKEPNKTLKEWVNRKLSFLNVTTKKKPNTEATGKSITPSCPHLNLNNLVS